MPIDILALILHETHYAQSMSSTVARSLVKTHLKHPISRPDWEAALRAVNLDRVGWVNTPGGFYKVCRSRAHPVLRGRCPIWHEFIEWPKVQ